MPTERHVLRLPPPLKSVGLRVDDDGHQNDSDTPIATATTSIDEDEDKAPALNDLIRALENSPPHKKMVDVDAKADGTQSSDRNDAKVSAMASGLISALENQTDATCGGMVEGDTKLPAEAAEDNKVSEQRSVARKKPTVSDDDDGSRKKKKKLKLLNSIKSQVKNPKTVDEPSGRTMEDFTNTIDEAIREHRIDEKKTARLRECLQSGDWSEIAYTLLCEQIPLKRKGKGYSCRVCKVPKKGHTCPFCHVCSTPTKAFKKDEEHVCFNCPTCFEFGKKNKKLIQVKCEGHVCPHGDP
ncbi:hypothetical protein ACHAXR_006499 [Thalassiosira sp. AJA248-18]